MDIPRLLKAWGSPFFWENKRRADVSFWFGQASQHSAIRIDSTSSRFECAQARDLAIELAQATDADLATLHRQFESDQTWKLRYAASYPLTIGVTSHDLRKSIPDLPWVSIFGTPYLEMFGRAKLETTPVFLTQAIGTRHWLIQLSEHAPSHKHDAAGYEQVRDAAKVHLGVEYFLDLARPDAKQKTPDFSWSPEIRNPLLEHLRANNLLEE